MEIAVTTALADFWAVALGWTHRTVDADGDVRLADPDEPDGPALLLMRHAAPTPGKRRVHLDVWADPDGVDATADRLVALGARRAPGYHHVTGWVVLLDPEGNELCVLAPSGGSHQRQRGR